MDQIYLLYEKCQKESLDIRKSNAIIMANALVYASPSYDNKASNRKQQMWNKFINSLDFEKIIKRRDIKTVKKEFMGLGLPVKTKKVSDQE